MTTTTVGVLPVPANFPIHWADPADERLFWTRDTMHFPRQVKMADQNLLQIFSDSGFGGAASAYSMPVQLTMTFFNTFQYQSVKPVSFDPLVMERLGREVEEKMGLAMAEIGRRWDSEYLPEIQRALSDWQSFDLEGASTGSLVEHFNASLDRYARFTEVHFLVVFPAYLAMSLFDEFYRDLFEDDDAFAAYTLLQGLPNKTVEAGRALWDLSRLALTMPEVVAALQEHEPGEVMAVLGELPSAGVFVESLNDYLREYGRRGAQVQITPASWIEDPSPAIILLKEYVNQPDQDLAAEQARLAAEREHRIADAREQIALYPAAVREQFEFLLAAAQTGVVLSEDHNFYIDYATIYELRRIVLEAGRRLASGGAIETRDDVFHLSFAEMDSGLLDPAVAGLAEKVRERKAELAHFSTIEPPEALGTPPAGPPPDDPISRAMGKFFGTPPAPATTPDTVTGAPGSAGVARGVAKVLRSLGEASRLEPGDILVTTMTDSAWTPIFATVGALVTDTGGVLSHAAVVAREYGIPAVVGTGMGTVTILDGQLIEVDGDAGVVRVIDPA